jgi:hypothetical protein
MIDLNLNPSKKELRTFGLCAMAFLAFVAWIVWRKTGSAPASLGVFGAGIAIALLGLTIPQVLKPLFVGLMIVNYPIGWVVTHIVMAFIFYCVVTPVGVIMRLSGRDPMERTFDRTAKTYWKRRRQESESVVGGTSRYFRQF